MTSNDNRPDPHAEYIAGLRQLADILERNPDLPLPYTGTGSSINFSLVAEADPRGDMAALVRALPCKLDKRTYGDGGEHSTYLELAGQLRGLRVSLSAYRNVVCERVVTGTDEVTKTVKDPEALAKVPEIEVTETIEIVEWNCAPVLAPAHMASA